MTHRKLHEITGVSPGNVNYLLRSLREENIITAVKNKKFEFRDYKKNLGIRAEQYIKKLRDDFFTARFKPAYPEFKQNRMETPFKLPDTLWGGEQVAYLMLRYLRPIDFTIYTAKDKKTLPLNIN